MKYFGMILISTILLIFTFTGCTNKNSNEKTDTTKETDTVEERDTTEETDTSEEIDTSEEADISEETDTTEEIDTSEEIDTAEETDTDENSEEYNGLDSQFIVYENKKFGFSLEFPISWGDNYIIKENEDYIEINFVGDSETSKNYYEESSQINGLTMFYIGSEDFINDNIFLDSVREIGRANDISYYYFTDTDYPLSALINDYIKDDNEKKLAADDYIIAKKMTEDIENIIDTFKSIE